MRYAYLMLFFCLFCCAAISQDQDFPDIFLPYYQHQCGGDNGYILTVDLPTTSATEYITFHGQRPDGTPYNICAQQYIYGSKDKIEKAKTLAEAINYVSNLHGNPISAAYTNLGKIIVVPTEGGTITYVEWDNGTKEKNNTVEENIPPPPDPNQVSDPEDPGHDPSQWKKKQRPPTPPDAEMPAESNGPEKNSLYGMRLCNCPYGLNWENKPSCINVGNGSFTITILPLEGESHISIYEKMVCGLKSIGSNKIWHGIDQNGGSWLFWKSPYKTMNFGTTDLGLNQTAFVLPKLNIEVGSPTIVSTYIVEILKEY